ncbi:hypothetical protein LCGC14_0370870 [marine sediment metagenome]|uniref:Uncharacterized protein n=1 Tax=marine sediment metagenome TaxID=412755 RepID=A0A0F9VSG7_9ZZZZ|nr:hypothetical protein [Maribacter sp.]HDZ04849.1 hypothetical protein [Maribacter sp.]
MKSQELRIGNWVDFEYGETERTYGFETQIEDAEDLVQIEHGNMKCRAIPLTKEWLEKFGFVKKTHSYTKDRISIKEQRKGYYFYHTGMEIKYVHQVQNLYYALTNEELTLKDETVIKD